MPRTMSAIALLLAWPLVLSAQGSPGSGRQLSATTYLLSRLDDNVNRDSLGVTSVGVISGMGLRWVSAAARPTMQLEYDVALHRYTATDRFNRVSQRARGTLSRRLARWLTLELVTEGALKGSFEDRDVSDQLVLLPRADIKLGSVRRLRLAASQRWRQFPTDSLQDAANRYASAEFRHRHPDGSAFTAEFRVERNRARGGRFDFRRTSYTTTYEAPISRRALFTLEMQYRIQEYPGRLVEVEDEDVARRDHRLQPTAALQLQLPYVDLELSYEPEWRRSNDPTRSIDQHVLLLGLRHRW